MTGAAPASRRGFSLKKDVPPPAAKAGEAAGKPDEKPCEPVKPCPIDG